MSFGTWIRGEAGPAARLAGVQAVSRVALAFVFLWHGLVPKLLVRQADELAMLRDAGLSAGGAVRAVAIVGVAEVAYAAALLLLWRVRALPLAASVAMLVITPGLLIGSPRFIPAAFNPVTLNLSTAALGIVAWLAGAAGRDGG